MHEHCTDCQTLGSKSFSYSEGMPFSKCPMALSTNALPLGFLLLDEVPKGVMLFEGVDVVAASRGHCDFVAML